MNRKDLELMMEAYGQIEEGFFSRAKARVAGVAGSAKGAIERGKGKAQQAVGRAASLVGATTAGDEMQAAGAARVVAGQGRGDAAKRDSIKKSIIAGVVDDLENLGLEGEGELVDNIEAALIKVFDEFLISPESETASTQPTPAAKEVGGLPGLEM
tara:strand:+ start:26995 stop:27462 length:468 start_codon:yes stop_codon:yes gene_type:complete